MDDKKRIIGCIAAHSNYPTSHPLGIVLPTDINEDQLMYTYGSKEEFDRMIAAIEQRFDVILLPPPGKDIGEMTVREFVDGIAEMLEDDDED